MLTVVRFWILLSTLLVGAGWILSACHQLNRIGYGVAFALAAAALFAFKNKVSFLTCENFQRELHKIQRRFRRPAPLLFLMLALLSFVSGVLYAPYNCDTYAYRLPRVLHWLGQEQWHWIHTGEMRMNVAGCGFEWLVAPIMLFTGTDRFLFLINWVSYLLLPGLIFCVFRYSGLRRHVAWWWSWLLASGWCYVMQSASVTNDALTVIYALAAVALAMKARETERAGDFWLALLAAALLTGLKQTAIPLVVLWLLAAWPARRIAFANLKTLLVMVALSLLVSGVPIMVSNLLHTGTWDGISAIQSEYPDWRIQLNSPFWGIIGNAFCIPVQNLIPPFFPWNGAWNHAMSVFVTTPFGAHFKSFEGFGKVSPGISEASAGIGLTVVLMTVISIFSVRKCKAKPQIKGSYFQIALRLCPWILLVIFMAKVGTIQNGRQLAGYYVFLFPLLLANAGYERLVRQGWWQKIALLCMATATVLLLVDKTHPLFPAVTVTQKLSEAYPHSKTISILHDAYTASRSLEKATRQIQEQIPPNVSLLGYAAIGNAQLEPALWLPFGTRRVVRVLKADSPAQLIEQGIQYVVIENFPCMSCTIDDWMARYHARLISELTFQDKGSVSTQIHVYLMRLDSQ